MSDTPLHLQNSDKKSMNRKLVIVIVVILVLLGIGGLIIKTVTQKASSLVGEKVAEKMIENTTGGKADVDVNSDSLTVKTDEGTFSTSSQLPADWPKDAPIYPGSTVTYSGSSNPKEGSTGFSVMATTSDAVQKVTDYYTKELVSQGWTIETTQNMAGTSVLAAVKASRNLTVSASVSDNLTAITLIVATQN